MAQKNAKMYLTFIKNAQKICASFDDTKVLYLICS